MTPPRLAGAQRIVAAAAALLVAATGCGLRPAAADRGPGTLIVDIVNYPATLDPARQYDTDSYSVYRNIFDQLLRRDPKTNAIKPWLATKWEQTDPTTWKFTMREGVTFSDGAPLTARDAAYSIARILDKDFASQQFANFSAIDEAEASADGKTLTIRTKVPSPTLLSYLATLSVVPRDYVEKVGEERFNQRPVGSGPYVLKAATAGSEITLQANPRWWGPDTDVTTAVFRSVPNVASRVADLQARKADIVTGLTPDAADQIRRDPALNILSTPTERVAYLAFNTIKGGPANDKRVRKAITAAIDYKALINNLQRGYAKEVNSLLTPLAFGYPQGLPNPKQDRALAKRLIKEAGAEGKRLTMVTSPAFDPQIVQAIQGDLAAIGLNVEIETSDQPTYLKKVQDPAHNWGSLRFGRWSCSCLDADGVIYPLFHTGTIWNSYENKEFDKVVEQGRTTIDAEKRKEAYRKAFGILNEDLPGAGLFQTHAIYGTGGRVTWRPDAQESFFLADMEMRS